VSVITWQNDPLLFDPECQVQNEWLTANKLIENGQEEKIFADRTTLTLNLFPILVRRIDFVRKQKSDRILSRFPFLVLSEEEKELIKSKILLIAEFARNYFYKSLNDGILSWRRRLDTYLERGAMPFPLFRCACAILQLQLVRPNANFLSFESARGKKYTVPTKLTKQLAYLCGVCNGDGHLDRHWLRIVDETKEHIQLLSKIIQQLFSDSGEIFKTKDMNAWNVDVRSSAASRLINFLTDQTIDGAKYGSLREPLLFKTLGEPFRKFYWGGVMDADGSYKKQITFTSASEQFVIDLHEYLKTIKIASKVSPVRDVATCLHIPAKHKVEFIQHIGVLNPKKANDYQDFLKHKRSFYDYQSINEKTLTSNGYFNLDLMDSLYITGFCAYLREYRGIRTYTEMREKFDLAVGSYSNYENGKTALPYSVLQKIVQNQFDEVDAIYSLLGEKKEEIKYQVSSSMAIKLPLKPTYKLHKVLPFLEPKINYVRMMTKDSTIIKEIRQIFDIKTNDNPIKCILLVHFLKTFCKYKETNNYLSMPQFKLLQQAWRNQILDKN